MSNLASVLDVDGIDGVFGPADLSADMGTPRQSRRSAGGVENAIDADFARRGKRRGFWKW